jgi:hypothetical protein
MLLVVVGSSLLATGAAASIAAQAAYFQTPSRNIVCGTGPSAFGGYAVTCTVFSEANRRRGQKIWALRSRGRARVFFSMSNAPVQVRVLRYGRTYRGYGIHCTSRKVGLTCRNRSQHGFFLSRQRQRVF